MTTGEVLDTWRGALKKGARDMLDLLVDAYPQTKTRGELGAQLNMVT